MRLGGTDHILLSICGFAVYLWFALKPFSYGNGWHVDLWVVHVQSKLCKPDIICTLNLGRL
jgi:hypothetical protein